MVKYSALRVKYLFVTLFSIFMVLLSNYAQQADDNREIRDLITRLQSDDPIKRAYAAIDANHMGVKAAPAIPYLIKLLDDYTPLEWRKHNVDPHKLYQKYEQTPPQTSPADEARRALISIGEPAILPVIGSLKKRDIWDSTIEKNLIYFDETNILYEIGEPAVIPLIEALEDTLLNLNERKLLLVTLGCIRDTRIVDIMLSILEDTDHLIRLIGANSLDRINWTPVNFTQKARYSIAKRDWDGCVDIGSEAVKPLIDVLNDKISDVQIGAAKALSRLGDTCAVYPLIKVLHDANPDVRCEVASALGSIKDPKATKPLFNLINDDDPNVRESVATALGDIGQSALGFLIAASKDPDVNVRAGAVQAIGMIQNPQVFGLLKSAMKDEEPEVREKAIEGLVNLKDDPRSFDLLVKALLDEKIGGAFVAAEALGERRDPRAVKPLISVLKKHDDKYVRRMAVYSLGIIGDPRAVKSLNEALKYEDRIVKIEAAKALGRINDPSAVNALILALGKTYYRDEKVILKNAVEALGRLKDPWAVSALVKIGVCGLVAEALGKIGLPAAELLIHRLKSENREGCREDIAKALGKIEDPIVLQPLREALKDDYFGVRREAAIALGDMRDTIAVEALLPMLQDNSDFTVREEAAVALGKLKDPRSILPLIQVFNDEDYRVRYKAAFALAGMGQQAMEPLIASLKDPEYKIRAGVVKTIGMIEDNRVVDLLIGALNDEAEKVRLNAVEALRKYKEEPKVIKTLEYVALNDKNDDIRRSAVREISNKEILAEIAQNDSIEIICKMAHYGMLDQYALLQVVYKEPNISFRKEALERIYNDTLLTEIVLNINDSKISGPAVRMIRDQSFLMEILNKTSDYNIQYSVTEKITDQSVLINIAKHGWKDNTSWTIKRTAIERIMDQTVLEDIAMNDPNKWTRESAEERLRELK